MPTLPPPVDSNGNITVPQYGGVVIPITMQDPDNAPVDISAMPLRFVAGNRVDKMLVADPDVPTGRLLILTEDDAKELSTRPLAFALLDQTVAPHIPVWEGTIRKADR